LLGGSFGFLLAQRSRAARSFESRRLVRRIVRLPASSNAPAPRAPSNPADLFGGSFGFQFLVLSTSFLAWAKLSACKYHTWIHRYGLANEHNGKIPRDWWVEDWEKQAILDFHERNPLEGYRRLTFMMLDDDIVAVSPSSTYHHLKRYNLRHGRIL
jgi:hypothetical protein